MKLSKLLFIVLSFLVYNNVSAQIAIPNATPVTQNFDGIGSSPTASLPANWKFSPAGDTTPTYANGLNFTATNQEASSGSPTTGARYNWGNGTTTTDRAIGFMTSGGYASPNSIMAHYQNTSGVQINDLTISFDYERYRINSAACAITFFTSTDGSTWTARTAGDSGAFSTGANTYTFTGGTVVSRSFTITGVNIANSSNFYLRWNFDTTGSNSQGVGLDNVSVTATLASPSITTFQNGPWYVGTTWIGGVVPTNTQNVIINHAVTMDAAVTRNSGTITTISSSGSLATGGFLYTNNGTLNENGVFRMDNLNAATGNNFNYGGTSTLVFNSASNYSVNNGDAFWPSGAQPFNVTVLQGGFTMNAGMNRTVAGTLSVANGGVTINATSSLLVNGTCLINASGFFNNSPIYGSSSLLRYNTGGTYGRGFEWFALGVGTIGTTPGYPNNVQVSNNTTIDYINGAASGAVGVKAMAGNFTIDSGSALHMNFGGVSSGGSLIVAGDVNINGTLTLGQAVGDDLRLAGNFNNTGIFNGNNRAVYFTKTGTQTVTSTPALTIPYVLTTGSGTTVQLLSNLTISAPLAGIAVNFGAAADRININGRTLTVGSAGIDNTISGLGSFIGSTTSNLTLLGTNSIGILRFAAGSENLGTLTVNRTASAVGCTLGSNLAIATNVTLTAGHIDLANNTMTMASGSTITNASAANYIIADKAYGANALLSRTITAAGTYTYPIGDRAASADGSQYSPVSVTFTGGSYGGTVGYNVDDIKHPNMDATATFITRYWEMKTTGTISPTSYTFNGTYLPVDINGTETQSISNQWNGTSWTNNGSPIGGNVCTIGANTVPATNHFTAGLRDREINIVQVATNYLTGSTYNFGTIITGNFIDVVFTIQNTGQQTLTLGATPSIVGNPPYALQVNYASTTVAGMVGSTPGTQTFTIRFAPTAAGTFTGSITITNNDADENPYVINFTGVGQLPAPNINLRGATGGTNSITNGAVTTSGLNNTAFGSINLGSNVMKDFRIENLGTATLNLTGVPLVSIGGTNPADFTVTLVPTTPVAVSGNTVFNITFTPQASGYRSAVVSIANNDSTKNPYTFLIDGTGVCTATANTITPSSGPAGTEVTITATTNNLTGASAVLNSASLTVNQISSTQITVIVPSGNFPGTLTTTNAQGCKATNYFNVITNAIQSCQGSGPVRNKIFISEITDHGSGSHSYVELFNGTGASVNLSGYTVRLHHNGNATATATITLPSFTMPNNSTYVIGFGGVDAASNPGGVTPNLTNAASGINNNDNIRLFDNTSTWIDQWGDTSGAVFTIAAKDYCYRRKNVGITAPSTTWNPSDWWSFTPVDYSDVGLYDYSNGISPTVTLQPVYTPTCKEATITIAGAEGFAGGNPLAYQWYAVAPNTANWTLLSNGGLYSGVTTAILQITDVSTLTGFQFYCQIRENTASCYTATNAVKITPTQSTTWQASNSWSNGPPTIDKVVVIDHTYDTANAFSPSFSGCTVTVNSGQSLTVRGNHYVQIKNELTVAAGGTATFENNSSLVQINNVTNSGNITYKRIAQQRRLDYVYWSSPVNGYSLSSHPSNGYKYLWNTTLNNANGTQGNWQWYTGVMNPGIGYIVNGPSSFNNTSNQNLEVPFIGVPRNGNISVTVNRGSYTGANYTLPSGALVTNLDDNWNLLGNPYPSSISARDFLTANGSVLNGALYIWTHGTLPSTGASNPFYDNFISNYNPSDYVPLNLTGNLANPNPDYYIGAAQGFFSVMQDGAAGSATVNFTNSMRNISYGNVTGSNFFRNSSASIADQDPKFNRIWLELAKPNQPSVRTMFGYVEEATNGVDPLYDAPTKFNNSLRLYSFNEGKEFVIQGRGLPFNEYDQVPIGVDVTEPGIYTLGLAIVDGLFENENRRIYLEDTALNVIHDLKQAPYSFALEAGSCTHRFIIRYTTNSLSNQEIDQLNNSIYVSTQNNSVSVKSTLENIKSIQVYDLLGRQLYTNNKVLATEFSTVLSAATQTLIVKVQLENGYEVSKKTILK